MRYDNQRFSLLMKLAKHVHNIFSSFAVQVSRGFVRDDYIWVIGQSSGNSNTLMLPP